MKANGIIVQAAGIGLTIDSIDFGDSRRGSERQQWVEASGLKQADIAERLGVDQPRVSDIKNGTLSRFTIDRLVEMAARIGLTTRLTVSRKAGKAA